jgi:phage replication-related protein YjqB (UPF0714/DUF867 family)
MKTEMNNYRVFVVRPDGQRVEQRGVFVYDEDVETFKKRYSKYLFEGERIEVESALTRAEKGE